MSRALLDRFWVVEFAGPTLAEFADYGARVRMHPAIRGFLEEHPDQLLAFDPEAHVSPTPRSWADLSLVLRNTSDLPLMMQAASGHVGPETGQLFAAYVEMYGQLPRFDDVVQDPENAKLPTSFAGQYMMALSLVARLVDFWEMEDGRYLTSTADADRAVRAQVHNAVVTYMLRLPAELQMTMLTGFAAININPQKGGAAGNSWNAAAAMQKLMSDFRTAKPENAEAYKQLTATMGTMSKALATMAA